jgi:TonB-dependent receptor
MNGASIFTILSSIAVLPAVAQDDLQEVVVTSQRAALEAAQAHKEASDQILDSISADDAGKLPDTSVSEVLQRIPGVSITYFSALGDPDHFSAEGSGVTVRGLSQVSSVLNGRESFSATGGRGLLWEDVPPELLSSVDVYKSPTADQIEGGIGGSIDLHTKLPFDFKKETLALTATGNYSDFVKDGHPGGSALYANNWDTPAGRFGLVVDMAYSDLSSRDDFIRNEPYYPQTFNGQSVLVPGGFDFGDDLNERKRLGSYEAAEWSPSDQFTAYQTFFRSDYWNTKYGFGVFDANGYGQTVAPGSTSTFGSNGGLLTSSNIICTTCGLSGGGTLGVDGGASWQHNVTTDVTEGFTWTPTQRLQVKGAFQYVESAAQTLSIDIFPQTSMPSYAISETGQFPVITPGSTTTLANPSTYIWEAGMDHKENHVGRELAWNGDADYDISEDSFFRSAKVGFRVALRTEKDDVSGYNWQGIDPPWEPVSTSLGGGSSSNYTYNELNNFFQGKTKLPGGVAFPSVSLLNGYPGNYTAFTAALNPYGTGGLSPIGYLPNNLTEEYTHTAAGYGMVRFAEDDVFGMKFNGTAGLRYVYNTNHSNGFLSGPTGQVLSNGVLTTLPNTYINDDGGRSSGVFLPTVNFQFLPTDDIHVRFAAYQAMTNPDFTDLSSSGSLSFLTNSAHQITGATITAGNPNLKPQLANNFDVSLEYYMPTGGQMHVAGFYKKIKDYLSYGSTAVTAPYIINGQTNSILAAEQNYYNGAAATVQGAEIGAQKFFTFLPDPFDGLGVDTNFTYIDSQAPGDLAYDMFGNKITGLPVDQLSRFNYNITGMYEKGPVSLRLAYSWRSKYLMTTNSNGTAGTYTNSAGNTILYSLPIYGDDFGTLDASITYKINSNLEFSLLGANLTDSVQKTLMGYGQQQFVRSWFIQDRRYQGVLRATF